MGHSTKDGLKLKIRLWLELHGRISGAVNCSLGDSKGCHRISMLKELGGMLLTQVGRWKGCSKESVKVSFSHPGFQSVLLAMRNCPTKRKLTTYGATMTLEQCFSVFFFPPWTRWFPKHLHHALCRPWWNSNTIIDTSYLCMYSGPLEGLSQCQVYDFFPQTTTGNRPSQEPIRLNARALIPGGKVVCISPLALFQPGPRECS